MGLYSCSLVQSSDDALIGSDLPYSPSYVLSLDDQFSIKNLRDTHFLPGFNTPTLAMLFSPNQTWAGRYGSTRDTFQLEIRTFDVAAGYPLLS